MGLVSSARDTRPSNPRNEADPGEALGDVDSSILLMDWRSRWPIWHLCDTSEDWGIS